MDEPDGRYLEMHMVCAPTSFADRQSSASPSYEVQQR